MKVYIVINNNHEDFEDYNENIAGIFKNKEDAEKCVEKCNKEYYDYLKFDIDEYEQDEEFNDYEWIKCSRKNMEEFYFYEIKCHPARIEEWDVL